MHARQVLRTSAGLAEGPRWDAARRRLLWVDIEAGALHELDPATGADRALALGARVGATAPIEGTRVLVALEDRLAEADLATGAVRTLAAIPGARPGLRMNDGACDPAGRFWFGSKTDDDEPGAAALHRYDGAALDTILTGLTLANGVGWSPSARRMYFVDSLTYRVDVLDYDMATGAATNRREFAAIDGGIPDGLAVDDEGGVWVALYGGAQVKRFTAGGEEAGVLP